MFPSEEFYDGVNRGREERFHDRAEQALKHGDWSHPCSPGFNCLSHPGWQVPEWVEHENKLGRLSKPPRTGVASGTPQAREIADRQSKSMATAADGREFVEIAESFRRDADAEDANPTYKH